MKNSNLNKLADSFYKLAKEKKSPATSSGSKSGKKGTPASGAKAPSKSPQGQVAKSNPQQARRKAAPQPTPQTAEQKIQKSVAMDIFPTPIGNLSSSDLYKHYGEMADRINQSGDFDYFSPGSLVSEKQYGDYNAPVPVCMVEGGDGIKAKPYFWRLDSVPALLVRFCNSSNNPFLSDTVGYAKRLLESAGIPTYNYIIEKTNSANNKIRNKSYDVYVYVALDLDEDKVADDSFF